MYVGIHCVRAAARMRVDYRNAPERVSSAVFLPCVRPCHRGTYVRGSR